ncbi:MAG: hypothetical protein FD188_3556, partial [Ignavibacteria bacterium]
HRQGATYLSVIECRGDELSGGTARVMLAARAVQNE